MSADPPLRIDDLSAHFGGNQGVLGRFLGDDKGVVRAVDNISLDIGESDVVVPVGESGCGKTTLGKAMVGLRHPTSGTVRSHGQGIWKSDLEPDDTPYKGIRKSFQMVHQDAGDLLDPNRTIFKSLNPTLKKWRPELNLVERRELIRQMLDTVGLTPIDDYASRYPHQPSDGGARQTVIVRSMLLEPDLILADETVSALDISLRVNLVDLLLELQEMFSTSFVFISHSMASVRCLISRAGGRIAVMYLGRIIEIGPTGETIKNPQYPYTKSLLWMTSGLSEINDPIETPPVRKIDIPGPENPPSGCRFHTHCPEAWEYCASNTLDLSDMSGPSGRHEAACLDAHDRIDCRNNKPITDDLDVDVADDAEQPAD